MAHVFVLLLVVLGQSKLDGTEILIKTAPFATMAECQESADALNAVKPTSQAITGFHAVCSDVAIKRDITKGSI